MKERNKTFLIILPLLILAAGVILTLSLKTFKWSGVASGCGCDIAQTDGSFDLSEKQAVFLNQEVEPALAALPEKEKPLVLGEDSPNEKWIEINLSEQKLIAWRVARNFWRA